MKPIRILDLFTGIGGFALGAQRSHLPVEHVGFVEIDKHCQALLEKRFPGVEIYDDVRGDLPFERGDVDLICGGFPCQDISDGGKKRGLEGERSGLWFEMHKIIKRLQPGFVVIENVGALRKRGLSQILRDLSGSGYDAEWETLQASQFGYPHTRKRLVIVAWRTDTYTGSIGHNGRLGHYQERILLDTELYTPTKIDLTPDPDGKSKLVSFREVSSAWPEAGRKFKTLSDFSRSHDEFPGELDKLRKRRIKQLGNALMPAMAEYVFDNIFWFIKADEDYNNYIPEEIHETDA